MRLTVFPGLIVNKKVGYLQKIFQELHSIVIGILFQTLLFEFLSFSKTLLFGSFIIFKRTHGRSKPSNYIYFTKKNNEWIVDDNNKSFFFELGNASFENYQNISQIPLLRP